MKTHACRTRGSLSPSLGHKERPGSCRRAAIASRRAYFSCHGHRLGFQESPRNFLLELNEQRTDGFFFMGAADRFTEQVRDREHFDLAATLGLRTQRDGVGDDE